MSSITDKIVKKQLEDYRPSTQDKFIGKHKLPTTAVEQIKAKPPAQVPQNKAKDWNRDSSSVSEPE